MGRGKGAAAEAGAEAETQATAAAMAVAVGRGVECRVSVEAVMGGAERAVAKALAGGHSAAGRTRARRPYMPLGSDASG